MKIISKWKDYYDHLSGVYGEDPKIILDRRKGEIVKLKSSIYSEFLVKAFIAGMVYEGILRNGVYYWGEELKELGKFYPAKEQMSYNTGRGRHYVTRLYYDKLNMDRVGINLASGNYTYHTAVTINPYKDDDKMNEKHGAPIVVTLYFSGRTDVEWQVFRNPRLSDIGIQRIIEPKDLYLALSAYLAPKDPVSSPMSDKQKAEAKGFDTKRSFRPKMK